MSTLNCLLVRTRPATLQSEAQERGWAAIDQWLRRHTVHVLHFVGHGDFDERREDGVLYFCDDYGRGVVPEAMALASLGIFSNAELLRMWTEHTAAAIFPKRKIGRLRPGYEASFLVLGANPLRSFEAVRTIELRVKEGEILSAK